MQSEATHLRLQALDHWHGRVLIEVVHNQDLVRPRLDMCVDPPQGGNDVVSFVVDRDDDRKRWAA
jgi:hypothetical protein